LQHLQNIADGNGQGAARTAFADDGNNHRHFQFGHHIKIAADGFGLAALFSIDPWIGARRVNEGHHGQTEFFCQFHQAQSLAIAFRTRHAEVAVNLVFGIAPLLVPDHHHRLAVETGKATDNRMIVRKSPVAVQLFKVGKNQRQVIKRIRALRMPCHLRNLPGRQLGVDILGQLSAFFLQAIYVVGNINRGIILNKAQLFDLGFKVGNGLFEVEETCFHGQLIF